MGLEESWVQPSHHGTNRSSVLRGGKMTLEHGNEGLAHKGILDDYRSAKFHFSFAAKQEFNFPLDAILL